MAGSYAMAGQSRSSVVKQQSVPNVRTFQKFIYHRSHNMADSLVGTPTRTMRVSMLVAGACLISSMGFSQQPMGTVTQSARASSTVQRITLDLNDVPLAVAL